MRDLAACLLLNDPNRSSSKYRPTFPRNSQLISRPRNATIVNAGARIGGERGIRTLEGLLALTPLAGVRLRPLGHLSGGRNHKDPERFLPKNVRPAGFPVDDWADRRQACPRRQRGRGRS